LAHDALTQLTDTIVRNMPDVTCDDIFALAEHLIKTHALPRATHPDKLSRIPEAFSAFGPLADAIRGRRNELEHATTKLVA